MTMKHNLPVMTLMTVTNKNIEIMRRRTVTLMMIVIERRTLSTAPMKRMATTMMFLMALHHQPETVLNL